MLRVTALYCSALSFTWGWDDEWSQDRDRKRGSCGVCVRPAARDLDGKVTEMLKEGWRG